MFISNNLNIFDKIDPLDSTDVVDVVPESENEEEIDLV